MLFMYASFNFRNNGKIGLKSVIKRKKRDKNFKKRMKRFNTCGLDAAHYKFT